MSLFGYDPAKYYTGRAPIEACGMGIAMDDGDVAFRCNLVYLDVRGPKVFMGDYSAGHITTEEARLLDRGLRQCGRERRVQVLSRRRLPPPHDLEGRIGRHGDNPSPRHTRQGGDRPYAGRRRARRIIKLMSDSQIFLNEHRVNRDRIGRGARPANSIWLWGQGKKPSFPPFREKYGPTGR